MSLGAIAVMDESIDSLGDRNDSETLETTLDRIATDLVNDLRLLRKL